jgi:hypothetical protein
MFFDNTENTSTTTFVDVDIHFILVLPMSKQDGGQIRQQKELKLSSTSTVHIVVTQVAIAIGHRLTNMIIEQIHRFSCLRSVGFGIVRYFVFTAR